MTNIKIIGVITVDGTTCLILGTNGSVEAYTEVLKDKKGSYIKMSIPESKTKKKYYITDDLWWAVNRFEKYLEEGE